MSDVASASGGKAAATANICNTRGLHARASAKFVKLASGFDAEIHVTRDAPLGTHDVLHGRQEFRGQTPVGDDHQADHDGFTKTLAPPRLRPSSGSAASRAE